MSGTTGLFDDLLPKQGGSAATGIAQPHTTGLFDDLLPKAYTGPTRTDTNAWLAGIKPPAYQSALGNALDLPRQGWQALMRGIGTASDYLLGERIPNAVGNFEIPYATTPAARSQLQANLAQQQSDLNKLGPQPDLLRKYGLPSDPTAAQHEWIDSLAGNIVLGGGLGLLGEGGALASGAAKAAESAWLAGTGIHGAGELGRGNIEGGAGELAGVLLPWAAVHYGPAAIGAVKGAIQDMRTSPSDRLSAYLNNSPDADRFADQPTAEHVATPEAFASFLEPGEIHGERTNDPNLPSTGGTGGSRIVRELGLPPDAQSITTYDKSSGAHKNYTWDPSFTPAKEGDVAAARDLVHRHVAIDDLAEARDKFGSDAIYVPVHAETMEGRNQIPNALAQLYAHESGGQVDTDIVQTNRVQHTHAKGIDRFARRAAFDGPVVQGGRYVIVDDTGVLGGTIGELANHIRSGGGEVRGVVTPADGSDRGTMAAPDDKVAALREKYGDAILNKLGIEPASLTDTEASFLLRHAGKIPDVGPFARGNRVAPAGLQEGGTGGDSVLGEGEAERAGVPPGGAPRTHEDIRADRTEILGNLTDEIRKSGGTAGSGIPNNLPEILKHVGALAQNIAEETGLYGKELYTRVQGWLAPLDSQGLRLTDDQIRAAHVGS